MKGKIEILLFVVTIILLSLVMIYWINQKEGFHEDEIFSYGSSNYKYDNVYQRYGNKDAINTIIFDEILSNSFSKSISNIKHYLSNPNEFIEKYKNMELSQEPIFKSSKDAKQYVSIEKEDIFDFFCVFYNQSRDVHPPLFYILVHIFSTVCFNTFSKYIIFSINLIFFLLTCFTLRKILKVIKKSYLSIPLVILYGLSVGTVSTMMFLRMYQMLTFFITESLYIHLVILQEELNINKKATKKLTALTILGFLTHYYYCIFALLEALTLFVICIKHKKYRSIKLYLKCIITSAIIGIVIFPASIYHIFFSYRGFNANLENSFFERLLANFYEIGAAFSLSSVTLIVIVLIILLAYIYHLKKGKATLSRNIFMQIIIPMSFYFLLVSLIAPQSPRYMSAILPIVCLILIISLDELLNNIKNDTIIFCLICIVSFAISLRSLLAAKPQYLYTGYKNTVEIARKYNETIYICICDNNFTYLSHMPEFLTYNTSIIINYNDDSLNILLNNKDLSVQNEIIVSVNKWMNYSEILNLIMSYTGYSNFELLQDSNELQTIIYRIYNS